jgi:glucosamine 6-phosphate synthetase-like amidotransferase/phosphosugar isomerase protein
MCGIAGYSLDPSSRISRTLAAQALLAAIAERGADAVGYAHRGPDGAIAVHKQRTGASALIDQISLPTRTTQVLIHVRDYTKGHPTIEANNHPVRHGSVVGIHNGIILNDEEIFARHGFERAAPRMTVDTEAILALAEESDSSAEALEKLCGSMASAWLDERRPDTLFAARGVARPLWLGIGTRETFFASTEPALVVVEQYLGIGLRKREVEEGTLLALENGKVARSARFRPNREFEETDLPAVRAPQESVACLSRLAAIAAALA